MSVEPQEILTLSEAAAYLRVADDVLREMATEHSVPARKIGNEWRFSKSSLREWLAGGLGAEERPQRTVLSGNGSAIVDALVEEVERRVLAKLAASKTKPEKGSKEAILALAGKWKDDPTLEDMLRDIYKQRGRPMTEEGE